MLRGIANSWLDFLAGLLSTCGSSGILLPDCISLGNRQQCSLLVVFTESVELNILLNEE